MAGAGAPLIGWRENPEEAPAVNAASLHHRAQGDDVDGRYAWMRLGATLVLATIGSMGIWSGVVVLPALQAEFGVARSSASLPYTLTMIGVAAGNAMMGRLLDRVGIVPLLVTSGLALGLGYLAAGLSASLTQFALASGLLIAFLGSSVTFGPLIADVSHWFVRRRGLAVSICASGSYLAGAIWPPVVQYGITTIGWRHTHLLCGLFCVVTIIPLAFLLRRHPAAATRLRAPVLPAGRPVLDGLSPGTIQALLMLAGLACCVAMAMPQVHLVAYCADLGYGPAHGAEMLSLMLGLGVVSRVGFGLVNDRIGGLRTLLLGSALQMAALLLYMGFDALASLYVISALFGLFQGGIVPSYAIIVRETFPPAEAGTRIGVVLTATMVGMALGGWMSGAIFDATGSYRAAFGNGVAWNLLNAGIAVLLLARSSRRPALA